MARNSVKYQYFATFCANIMSVSFGAFCGWPSSSFLVLQSDDTPLASGPISSEEMSWVGSLVCIGGLIGGLLYGWLSDKLGRKISFLLAAFPALLGWLIIPVATNVMHLCISRLLGGIAGGAVFSLVPIYVTEIAEDKVRGSLGSYLVMSTNTGIFLAFVLGNYLSYSIIPYIIAVLPILFLCCFSILPETPQYLLKAKKINEAEKAFRYFRNVRKISKEIPGSVQAEMEKLKVDFMEDEKNVDDDGHLTWSDFNNRIAKKAFMIGLALMLLNQLCGCFAMLNYTATIFKESGSNLSPNMSAIVVGAIQVLGAYLSTLLVERAGRKPLILISSIGTGVGLSSLGLYMRLSVLGFDVSAFQWVPVTSFSFLIFMASLGILTLPFLILSEIMPPKIRNIGCSFCMTILWLLSFLMVKYLPIFNQVLGLDGSMFMFASVCFAGAVFIVVFIPETKGKSIDTIMSLL